MWGVEKVGLPRNAQWIRGPTGYSQPSWTKLIWRSEDAVLLGSHGQGLAGSPPQCSRASRTIASGAWGWVSPMAAPGDARGITYCQGSNLSWQHIRHMSYLLLSLWPQSLIFLLVFHVYFNFNWILQSSLGIFYLSKAYRVKMKYICLYW